MMKIFAVFAAVWCVHASAVSTNPVQEKIWGTREGRWLDLTEIVAAPGDVFVLGEQHAVGKSPSQILHHANQYRLMLEISRNHRVSLGMEFFEYPYQKTVDQYVDGGLSEGDFLRAVRWGSNPFPPYREQVRLPARAGGHTWALNIPRAISGKVARGEKLSPKESALLPPLRERGGADYFERFAETMRGHVKPKKIERFFMAQSLWDDTMAWRVRETHDPFEVYFVIVGEFHVEFGQGLPARLARYGVNGIKTVVQTEVSDWSEPTLSAAIAPDPRYGPRADYIWVYRSKTSKSVQRD